MFSAGRQLSGIVSYQLVFKNGAQNKIQVVNNKNQMDSLQLTNCVFHFF